MQEQSLEHKDIKAKRDQRLEHCRKKQILNQKQFISKIRSYNQFNLNRESKKQDIVKALKLESMTLKELNSLKQEDALENRMLYKSKQ